MITKCNICDKFDGVTCDFNGLMRKPDDDAIFGCNMKGFSPLEPRKKSSLHNDNKIQFSYKEENNEENCEFFQGNVGRN